ncbi:MAG: hypothetical protein KDE63_10085 [Novosphingobium sp.]|nr:hypothetical protein [Novosphingobium sp.]
MTNLSLHADAKLSVAGRTIQPSPKDTRAASKLLDELRALNEACASTANKHERAIFLIRACIEHGIVKENQIIGTVANVGFKHGHVASVLKAETGINSENGWWRREPDGTYSNLVPLDHLTT